jgi:hypothetical protein
VDPPVTTDADAADRHRLDRGARLQLGVDSVRCFSVACSCGWVSEACGTEVLADAFGEQHLTFAQGSTARKRRGDGVEGPQELNSSMNPE